MRVAARVDGERVGEVVGRVVLVDYLRGMAALAVAWFHLTNTYPAASATRRTGTYGWLGVEVFFVISGFIIPWSMSLGHAGGLGAYGRFLARRAIRVEVPYLASIVLVIGLWSLASMVPSFRGEDPTWTLEQVLLHLFYLIPFSDQVWLQPVYWTLAYEFVFYLFIGLAFRPIVDRGDSAPFLLCAVCVLTAVSIGILPVRFPLFLVGCAAYRRLKRRGSVSETATVMAAAAVVMISRGALASAAMGLAAAVLIVFGAGFRLTGSAHAWLMYLGAVSYSLYLLHVPIGGRIVNLGKRVLSGAPQELVISLTALAVSVGAAWAFFRLVELPSHRLSKWRRLAP